MKKQHKNVIRRTVAVGLATLIFFVPLSTGMGKGMGAKADDPSGTSGVTATYDNTETPYEISGNIIALPTDNQYKVVEGYDDISNVPEYKLHVADDSVEIGATINTKLSAEKEQTYTFDTTLLGASPQGVEDTPIDVTVTIKYKVTYEAETVCADIDSTNPVFYSVASPGSGNTTTLNTAHDMVGVYVKPIVKYEFLSLENVEKKEAFRDYYLDWQVEEYGYKDMVKKIFEDDHEQNLIDQEKQTAYSLQVIYKRVVDILDTDYSITQNWSTTPSPAELVGTLEVYKSAGIKPTNTYGDAATDRDYYIGTIKHVVKNSGAVSTALTETELAAIDSTSWSTDTLKTGNKTGYYYDYVAYFVDDSYVKYLQTSASVYIDADAPTVTSLKLFKATKDADGNIVSWNQLNVQEDYVLNLGNIANIEYDAYRYVIQATDSSGIADPSKWGGDRLFVSAPSSDVYKLFDGTPVTDNLYYYEIKYDDLPGNGSFVLSVPVKDKVGNEFVIDAISPSVKRFDYKLSASVSFSIDGKPITEFPNHSNQPIKLSIEVTSRNPIYYIDLYNKDDSGNKKSLMYLSRATVADDTHFEDSYVPIGGARKYTVSCEYTLPPTADNILYEELRLNIVDVWEHPYTGALYEVDNKDEKLGDLIYDTTVPVISYSDEYDGVRWYQDYKVSGNIVSGLQSVEDDFEYAEYYMSKSGSVDEVNDAPTKQLDADPNAQTPTCNFEFDVESSESLIGTKIVFAAKDKSGNILPDDNRTMVIHVDGEAPVIDKDAIYVVKKGTAEGKKVSSDSNLEGGNIISGNPVLQASVRDNLTIDRVEYTVKFPNGSEKIYEDTKVKGLDAPGVDYPLAFEIPNPSGSGEAIDGSYEVTIQAYDKSGRESEKQSVRFVLDNTKPVLSSWISVGTKGGKSPREDGTDWYYKSDQVGVSFKIEDDNIDTSKLVVKDGDSIVPVTWTGGNGFAIVSGNGSHTLTFEGKDAVGNQGTTQTVSFIIDTVEPTVSVQVNGQSYSASRGRINSTQDVYVHFGTSDTNPDYNDYYCRIVRQLPGQADSVREYTATSMTDYSFSEDGDYTVTFYAIDRAGNSSGVYSAMFRVDKNAPQLQIVGANGSATSDTAVTLVVNEAMWQDATAEATIYRRAGDGKEELVYKTIQLRLTSAETRISELLRETGTYRIEFSAKDAIGHSTSTSHTFTLDKNAPIVSQTGVSNYDKTDQPVTFYTEIHDDFYATKTVVVSGTRTDQSGKVTVLEFPNVKQNANPTIIENVFEEDGIYEVSVYVRDAAGNEKSSVLHFVIDKEAPVIGSLEDYEDKMFREFSWDLDLDELVSDLTVCDVHMYLNGREYDGESAIEDGVYTLLITAEDELGHKSEKSATFTLDTKPPVFIVTGVEDGEVKKEAYSIDISLQLDEDMLELVMLNGVPATVRENNTAHIDVTQEGDYNLTMAATDKAGNESMQVISFTYGTERQKRNWLVVILASGGGVLALGGIIFFAAKRRRNR